MFIRAIPIGTSPTIIECVIVPALDGRPGDIGGSDASIEDVYEISIVYLVHKNLPTQINLLLAGGLDLCNRLWQRIREAHHLRYRLARTEPSIRVVYRRPLVGCNRGRILRLDGLSGQRLSPILEDATPVAPGIEAADYYCHAKRRPSNRDPDDPANSHGIQSHDRSSGCRRGASGISDIWDRIFWWCYRRRGYT